jgi:L-ascorbate metabolism protein UlaG (beta-lactamase superfamily)
MVITWYGQACFRIQSGDKALVLDPFEKSVGLMPPSIQADILFVTHEHFDHNNIKAIKGDYFLINGPGEYEVKGIKAKGIASYHDNEKGAKRGLNTLYLIEVEGIHILHCGDLGQDLLDDKQLEEIGSVDILMIPTGGFFTIDAKQAVGVINQIEPKIVIPMHYKIPKLSILELDGVDKFLKEFGSEDVTAEDKISIRAKDIEGEEEKTRIIVLKP